MDLKGYQRGYLTRFAHNMQPLLQVGKAGMTNEVIQAISEALEAHEIIKVKFLGFKEEKNDLSRLAAEQTDSVFVRMTGNIAIFYRHQVDPKKRRVHLPK